MTVDNPLWAVRILLGPRLLGVGMPVDVPLRGEEMPGDVLLRGVWMPGDVLRGVGMPGDENIQ